MEALVHWFSQNLSQYISPEGAVFIISMIPILRKFSQVIILCNNTRILSRFPAAIKFIYFYSMSLHNNRDHLSAIVPMRRLFVNPYKALRTTYHRRI